MTADQNLAAAMRVYRIGIAAIAAGFAVFVYSAFAETARPVALAVNLVAVGYVLVVLSFIVYVVLESRRPTKEQPDAHHS